MLYGKLLFAIISKCHFYRNISWCSGFGEKLTMPFESTPWEESKYPLKHRFSPLYREIRALNFAYFSEKLKSDTWSTAHSFGSPGKRKYMITVISMLRVQSLSYASPLHMDFFLFDRPIFLGISACHGLHDENMNSSFMRIFILYTARVFDPCNQIWKILTACLCERNRHFFPKISHLQGEPVFCSSGSFFHFQHCRLPKLLFMIHRHCSSCLGENRVILDCIHHRTRTHSASRFSVFHMIPIRWPHVIHHMYIVI